jgi:hypothetical protein
MSEMGNIEMSGLTEQAGAAYLAWVRKNDKQVGKESIAEFLKTAKDKRINLSAITDDDYETLKINKTEAQQYVGTQLLRETRAVVDPYLNAEIFEQQQTAARAQLRAEVIAAIGGGLKEDQQAAIEQALFNGDATSFDAVIRKLGLDETQVKNAVNAYTNAYNYARHHNILWISDAQLERRKEIIRDYGSMERYASNDLTTSVLQYFKAKGEDATLADAVSVALFGHTGVIKDDSTAAKFIDGSMFASKQLEEKRLEDAQGYRYAVWKEGRKKDEDSSWAAFIADKDWSGSHLDPDTLIGKGNTQAYKDYLKNTGEVARNNHQLKLAKADHAIKSAEAELKKVAEADGTKVKANADGDGQYLTIKELDGLNTNEEKLEKLRSAKYGTTLRNTYGSKYIDAAIEYYESLVKREKLKASDPAKTKTEDKETAEKNNQAVSKNTDMLQAVATALYTTNKLLNAVVYGSYSPRFLAALTPPNTGENT